MRLLTCMKITIVLLLVGMSISASAALATPQSPQQVFRNAPRFVTWNADESRLIYVEHKTTIIDPELSVTTINIGDLGTREVLFSFTIRGVAYALSPDSKAIAYFEEPDTLATGIAPPRVVVANLRELRISRSMPLPVGDWGGSAGGDLWWSGDSSLLFFLHGNVSKTIIIWNVASGLRVHSVELAGVCPTVSPDLRYYTWCFEKRPGIELGIYEVVTQRRMRQWEATEQDSLRDFIQWSKDASRIAYVSGEQEGDRVVTSIWSLPAGTLVARIEGTNLGTDGRRIAIIDPATNVLRLHDFVTGKVSATAKDKGLGVELAKFSPDGKRLATAHSDSSIRIWDTAKLSTIAEYNQNPDQIWHLRWKPDGTQLLSWDNNQTLRLWAVPK